MTLPDFPTFAAQMRSRIEEALTDAAVPLGTYRYPGGQHAPALSLGEPPEGTTVEGLEVLIATNPKRKSLEAFEYLGAPLSYPVRLINHSGEPDVLEQATNALAPVFWPFDDDPALLPASASYPEQVTFSLFLFPTEE